MIFAFDLRYCFTTSKHISCCFAFSIPMSGVQSVIDSSQGQNCLLASVLKFDYSYLHHETTNWQKWAAIEIGNHNIPDSAIQAFRFGVLSSSRFQKAFSEPLSIGNCERSFSWAVHTVWCFSDTQVSAFSVEILVHWIHCALIFTVEWYLLLLWLHFYLMML